MNIRTEGLLSKEDIESLTHEKKYEGTGGEDLTFKPRVRLDGFEFTDDFDMLHAGANSKEGDSQKPASRSRARVGCVDISHLP